jgi:hypothetical protein
LLDLRPGGIARSGSSGNSSYNTIDGRENMPSMEIAEPRESAAAVRRTDELHFAMWTATVRASSVPR